MTGRYLGAFGACLCLLLSCATLADVEIGVDANDPPFMYVKNQQPEQAQGLYTALIRTAFARMQQPLTLHPLPWKRAMQAAKQQGQGIAGIYMSGERLQWLTFSAPLFEEQIVVYTLRPMTGQPREVRQLSDLHGLRVGVLEDWFYSDEFSAATRTGLIRAQAVSSDRLNLRKLLAGRVDAVLAVRQCGEQALRDLPQRALFVHSSQPLFANKTYLAFPRQSHADDLLQRFNQTLQAMHTDGSYAQIVNQELQTTP